VEFIGVHSSHFISSVIWPVFSILLTLAPLAADLQKDIPAPGPPHHAEELICEEPRRAGTKQHGLTQQQDSSQK